MFQQREKPAISSMFKDSRRKTEVKHWVENHLQSWDEFPSLKTLGDKVSSNFQDTARMSEPVPMFQLVSPVATAKTEQEQSKSCPAEKGN